MPSRRVLGLRGPRPAPPGGFIRPGLIPDPGPVRVVLSVAPVRFERAAGRPVPMPAVPVLPARRPPPMGGVLVPTARRADPMGGVLVPTGRRAALGGVLVPMARRVVRMRAVPVQWAVRVRRGVSIARIAVALLAEIHGAIAWHTARA